MFVQDLSKGNLANFLQQDMHLVKHALTNILDDIAAELNLKLFKRGTRTRVIRFDTERLERADFSKFVAGLTQGVKGGLFTAKEAREMFGGLEFIEGSDQLLVQMQDVPVEQAGDGEDAPPDDEDGDDADDETES